MTRVAALPLTFLILLATPQGGAAAQRQAVPAAAQDASVPQQSARETRDDLQRLLEQYGPALPRVLKLDPALLTNEAYLQPYPALRQFLAQHPDVTRNPTYYFRGYDTGTWEDLPRRLPQDRAYEMWNKMLDGFTIFFVFASIFGGVIWLIRTGIEHRRWLRLSKIQTEVHNKLLDRFTANEDLLAYIQTPAGKRFLESAPIPLDNPRAIAAPFSRILWSAQIGAILTIGGIGIEIVASRAVEEVAQPLAAVGVFVIAIGLGFLVSSALAYIISRRMGLLAPAEPVIESRG